MNPFLQIEMLIYNFIFGYILLYINKLNYKMIKNEVKILKIIITLLFALNTSCIYIIGVYKLANGNYNIYYFLFFIFGYYISYKSQKYVKKLSKKIKSIDIKFLKR